MVCQKYSQKHGHAAYPLVTVVLLACAPIYIHLCTYLGQGVHYVLLSVVIPSWWNDMSVNVVAQKYTMKHRWARSNVCLLCFRSMSAGGRLLAMVVPLPGNPCPELPACQGHGHVVMSECMFDSSRLLQEGYARVKSFLRRCKMCRFLENKEP